MALRTAPKARTTSEERRTDGASGFNYVGGQLHKQVNKLMKTNVPETSECSRNFQMVSTSIRKNMYPREKLIKERSLTVKRGPIMRDKTNIPKIGLRKKEPDPQSLIKQARRACVGGCWSNIDTHCIYDGNRKKDDGCLNVNYSYLDIRQVKKKQWKSNSQCSQRSMTQIRICASLCNVKDKIAAHELDFRLLRDEMFLNVVNSRTESVSTFCSLKCECVSDLEEYESVSTRCNRVKKSSDWACYHFKTKQNDHYKVEDNENEKKRMINKPYVGGSRARNSRGMRQNVQCLERSTLDGRNRGCNDERYNSNGRFLWKSNTVANTVAINKRKAMPESLQPKKFNTESYRNKSPVAENTTSRKSNYLKDSSTPSNTRSKSLIRRGVKDENTLWTNNNSTKPITPDRKNDPILTNVNDHDNAKRANCQSQKPRPVEKSSEKRYAGNSYQSKFEPERKANLNSKETNSKLGASKLLYDPKRGRYAHSCIGQRTVQNKPEREVKGKYQQQSKGINVQASGFNHVGGQLPKRAKKLMNEYVRETSECSRNFQPVSANAKKTDNKAVTNDISQPHSVECPSSKSRNICLQNTLNQKLELRKKCECEDNDVKEIRVHCISMSQKRIQYDNKHQTTNDNNLEMEVNDASLMPASSKFCGLRLHLNSKHTIKQQRQQIQQLQQPQQQHHHQEQKLDGKEHEMISRKPSEPYVTDVTVGDSSTSASGSSYEGTHMFAITVYTAGEVGQVMSPVSVKEKKSPRPKYCITVCYADPDISCSDSYDLEADIVSEETVFASSIEDTSSGKEIQNMNNKNDVNEMENTDLLSRKINNALAELGSIRCKREEDQAHCQCMIPMQDICVWQDAQSQMNAFKRKEEEYQDHFQYVQQEQNISVWDDTEDHESSMPTLKDLLSLDYNASNKDATEQNFRELLEKFECESNEENEIPAYDSKKKSEKISFKYSDGILSEQNENESSAWSLSVSMTDLHEVSSKSEVCCNANINIDKPLNKRIEDVAFAVTTSLLYPSSKIPLKESCLNLEKCCSDFSPKKELGVNTSLLYPGSKIPSKESLEKCCSDFSLKKGLGVTTTLLNPGSKIPRKESRLNLEKCCSNFPLKKELGSSFSNIERKEVGYSLRNEKKAFSSNNSNSSITQVGHPEVMVITSHGDAPKSDEKRKFSTESSSNQYFGMSNSSGDELSTDSEINKGSDRPMFSTSSTSSSSSSSSSPSSSPQSSSSSPSPVLDTKSVTHVTKENKVSIYNPISNICPSRTDQYTNEAQVSTEMCKECGGRQVSKPVLVNRELYKTTVLYSSNYPCRNDISSSINEIDLFYSDNGNEVERSNSEVIFGNDYEAGAFHCLLPERIYFAGAVYEKRRGEKRIYKKNFDEKQNRELYGNITRPRHSKKNRYLYAPDRYILNRLRRHMSLPALRRVYISEAFPIVEAGPPENSEDNKQRNSNKKCSDNWADETPAEWIHDTKASAVFKEDYKTEIKPKKENVCNVKSDCETVVEPVKVIWAYPNTKTKLTSATSKETDELSMNGTTSHDEHCTSCLTSTEQQGRKISQNNNFHDSEVSRRKINCSYDSLCNRKLHETKREKCAYRSSSEKKGPINKQMNETKIVNIHERKSELELYNEDFVVQENPTSKNDVLNSSSDDYEFFQDADGAEEFDENFQCLRKHQTNIPLAVNNASNNTTDDEIIIYFSTCCMHDNNSQRNRMNGQANPNGEAIYVFSPSSSKQDPDERRLSFKNIRCLAKKKISRRQRNISEKFHSCTGRLRSLFRRTSSKLYESQLSSNDEELFPVVHEKK